MQNKYSEERFEEALSVLGLSLYEKIGQKFVHVTMEEVEARYLNILEELGKQK
jgi:hypothetical protein